MIDLRKGNPPKSKKPEYFLVCQSETRRLYQNVWRNRGSALLSLKAKHPDASSISGGTVL
jgi:hypothetical protein